MRRSSAGSVIYPWMGCGLEACSTTTDFLVSDGKGGRVHTSIEGYNQRITDIGIVNGRTYFFTSDFVSGEFDLPEIEPQHNYWLSCPYEFRADGTMAEASAKVGSPFPALTIYYNA